MTAVDWDEVKRLAADFQKAQLSSSLQKLSERNCVEIISKLTAAKLLDIIFTTDGKEYVTPSHLAKEIKDELYVHGGRINLVELAKILNVDLSLINKVAADVERHDKGLKLILGQLIDKSYMLKIVGEINDKLIQNGNINVSELTLQYDLPADFLQSVIEKELGKSVRGRQDKQDPRIFYTEGFIARNRAKIRGALSAITKPTPVIAILGQCKLPERIFFSILESLQETMQVPGVVTGKQGQNAIYVPSIYSKSQSEWVDNFYKQNGYLEYDALIRLGMTDPRNFVKRHFAQEKLTLLNSVAVGAAIIDQVDANVDEIVTTSSFADIHPLLPSVFTVEDTETLLKEALKRSNTEFHIFANTAVVSEAYLQLLSKPFQELAVKRAKEAVESGKWLQSIAENKLRASSRATDGKMTDIKTERKEERRKKAASGKAGGGSQGRETKTRSTKKKYNQSKNQAYDSDEEPAWKGKCELTLITIDEIKAKLNKDENLADIENLVEQLAENLEPKLNKLAHSTAEQLAQTSKITNLSEIEERLNMLITNIRIFDKGIKLVDKNFQAPLTKYLMKSLAVDFATDLFKLVAQQNVLQCPSNLTTDARQKMLLELPADVKEPLSHLHAALAGNSVDEFLNSVESAMAACCLVLRKFDKKKERPVVLGHRQALLEQLRETSDPALALHLTTSVLFTAATQTALHMSGRHVASILTFLQSHLDPATVSTLSRYHDRVLELLSSNDAVSKAEAQKTLEDDLDKIKEIANNFKSHLKGEKTHE